MAKNKRPKFLDKETPELLAMLKETQTKRRVEAWKFQMEA